MSDSLIKANNVKYGNNDKRVIDSNQAVFDRLQLLNEIMAAPGNGVFDENYDGFVEGLGAENVDALFEDPEAEYGEAAQPVAVSREDIDELLNQARAQADEIIAAANSEADGIIAAANKEAESLKEQAYNEGMAQGSEAGYQDGVQKASRLEEELQQKAQLMQEEYEKSLTEVEPMIVEALTDIYSHVFGIDLSGRSEVILQLLNNTIKGIDGTKSYFVHVSKDDYEYVLGEKDKLSSGLAGICVVEIIEDVTLSAGQCYIEAESGIFDCSLGTELSNLQKELRILSYTPA